jgi:hypothetical protein
VVVTGQRASLAWDRDDLESTRIQRLEVHVMALPRIFDLPRMELAALRGPALESPVRASEGRTMVAEVFAAGTSLLDGVHNAEIMAVYGADIIVLNFIETAWTSPGGWSFPNLGALPSLTALASTIGRPVGVNLEPDPRADQIPPLRRASADNAVALRDAGAALFVVTANPGTGASYASLVDATKELRDALGDDGAIWSGKMHHAGRPERVTPDALLPLVDAGASGVLVPIPGTVPGVTRELATAATEALHDRGAIVLGTIGTSGGRHREAGPVAGADRQGGWRRRPPHRRRRLLRYR